MSARIRGHYRIDSSGRIEPMTDVNGPALQFRAAPPTAKRRNAPMVRIAVWGFGTAAVMVAGMFALPRIEREFIAAQSAQYASVHHMHGQKRHDAATKLLHGESVGDR